MLRNAAIDWYADDGQVYTDCVVFWKVSDPFGGLSNMAGGYPLQVNGLLVRSAEALYQACRFSHRSDWQQVILDQKSPMAAKMQAKKDGRRAHHSRPDWAQSCITIMQWVVRVKLAQHYDSLAGLLRASGDRAIVERSRRDRFWGAVFQDGGLQGRNAFGQVLMAVRHDLGTSPREAFLVVPPPVLPHFWLLSRPIQS